MIVRRAWRNRRHRALLAALLVAAVAVAGLGAWAIVGDVPFLTNPFRLAKVPPYLQPGDPLVESARRGATGELDVLHRIREQMYAAIPPDEALWGTRTRYGFRPADLALWTEHRQVRFRTYPPFTVPLDPSWSENPEGNLSWLADYQSLAWLRAPEQAYLQTGDTTYLDQVRTYLLDWIHDARAKPPPSRRTWYDDSVSIRTDVIVGLLQHELWKALSDAELAEVLVALREHGRLLSGYLDDLEFVGHNHNLFHALSLYNLATAIPSLRDAPRWRAEARARISALLPEMVDVANGPSLEQATWYHFLALQVYATADTYLSRHGEGLSTDELAVLSRMADFGSLLVTPTLELPAIGDTPYGAAAPIDLLRELGARGLGGETTAYVLSAGLAGTRPPDASFFPEAGYAIVRPTYSAGPGWADDLQLVIDTTNATKAHGHDDALSFVLTAAGGPLIIDSGGPYLYGDPARAAFVAADAHNTVIDVGRSGRRGPVTDLVFQDDSIASIVGGAFTLGAGAEDRRAIVLAKPNLVIVIDRVAGTDSRVHEFRLQYHLPPDAIATAHGDARGRVTAGPASFGYSVVGGRDLTTEVISGRIDPAVGWVTPDYAVREPGPVLAFSQSGRDAWFVTALEPAAAGLAAPPTLTVTQGADGRLSIEVVGATGTATLEVLPSGAVVVAGS